MKIKNKTNLTNTIIFKNNIHNKINDHNFDFSRIIIEKVVDENSIKSDDFPDETSILIFDNKNREITPFKRYVLLQNKIKELRKKEYSKKSVNEQILKNHDTIILKLIEKKKLSRQRLLISKEKFKSNKRLKMIRKYKSLKFIQDKIQSLKNKQQKITDRKIHTKNAVSDIVNSVETNKKTVSSYQKQIADLSKKLDSHKNTLEEKLDAISDINDKRKSMSEYIDNCSIHSENRLNVKERKIDSLIQAMQFIAAQMQKLVNLSNYMRSSLDKSKEFANYFLEIFNKRKKQHNRLSCVEMTENAIAFVGSQQNNLTQIKKIGSEINRYLDDKLSNLGEEDPAKTDKAKFLRDSKKYENEIASLSKKKVEAEILIESETKINKKLIDQLNSENENEKENLKELERILKKTEKSLKMTSQANELSKSPIAQINIVCSKCKTNQLFGLHLLITNSVSAHCAECNTECLKIRSCDYTKTRKILKKKSKIEEDATIEKRSLRIYDEGYLNETLKNLEPFPEKEFFSLYNKIFGIFQNANKNVEGKLPLDNKRNPVLAKIFDELFLDPNKNKMLILVYMRTFIKWVREGRGKKPWINETNTQNKQSAKLRQNKF